MKIMDKQCAKVTLEPEEVECFIKVLGALREINDAMDKNDANYLDVGAWACEQTTLEDAIDLLDNIVDIVDNNYTIELVDED